MHSSDRTLLASLGFADPDKKDRRHTLACQYLAQPEVMARVVESVRGASQPVVAMTEADAVRLSKAPTPPEPHAPAATLTYKGTGDALHGLTMQAGVIEQPITKGRGYLIGFWDVVSRGHWQAPWAEVVDAYARTGAAPAWPLSVDWLDDDAATPAQRAAHAEKVRKYDIDAASYHGRKAAWLAQPHVFTSRSFASGWLSTSLVVRIEVKARPVDVADIARQIALYIEDNRPGENDITVVATCYPMSPLDRETLARKGIRHIRLGQPFDDWCKAQANVNAADGGQEF